MQRRLAVVVVLAACVVFAGCSQLASPIDGTTPTATTDSPDPITNSPIETLQPRESTPIATDTPPVTPTTTDMQPSTTTATPTATSTPVATPTPTATPTTTPTATATPTTTPEPATLTIVRLDAEREIVVLRNVGGRPLDLGGYAVDFDNGRQYTFSQYVLEPGDTLTLHTGEGDDTEAERYAGYVSPVIDGSSDTVFVKDPSGQIVAARQASAGTTTSDG